MMDIQLERSYPTPFNNSPLLSLLLLSLASQKHIPMTTSSIKDEYDYIVVGGGASGSVIASRLSEESCVSVLLLEAGPVPPLLTEVPVLGPYFVGTNLDFGFFSVPQKYAARGLKNKQLFFPTGKMLGGSSSFSSLVYVRGNKKDYDYWSELGARGWSYNEIFRYFLKIEDNRDPEFLANGYHAKGGPITVERPLCDSILKEAASKAAVEMGYRFVDSNAEQQTGFYDFQGTLRNNQRCSPVKGYLVPAEKRSNLDISVNSFVTRLIFEDNKVVAVEIYRNGRYQEIKVKKEVIMTAGAINTPKILMLSGVGPKEVLKKFNIPIVADLPVGKSFHDHIATTYFFTMDPKYRSISELLSDPESINQYIETRSGPLSSINMYILAFLQGLNLTPQDDLPNYSLYLMDQNLSFLKGGLKPKVYKQLIRPYENETIYRCAVQTLHTRSRGAVTLNSSNPFDPPLINPNYLKVQRDLDDLVDGLKLCKKMLMTESLLKLGVKSLQSLMPGCEKYFGNDDEYFKCYARTLTFNYNHHVGTAKMGDPSDPTTVVDPELRVKGVKNLRVADASVMPQVPSGNILTPVLMVAEKASDMIKNTFFC